MAPNEPTPTYGKAPSLDPAGGHARDLEAQVTARAVQDPAFRARVLADPRAVFADMGLSIPSEVKIEAVEDSAGQYYLVLPALERARRQAGAALSDAELEHVAGGAMTNDTAWTGCASGQSGCLATNGIGCALQT
jgi:hypothetical protein